eukprot:1159553-Pelagomonas_calceolata.AAC.3
MKTMWLCSNCYRAGGEDAKTLGSKLHVGMSQCGIGNEGWSFMSECLGKSQVVFRTDQVPTTAFPYQSL